MNLIARNYNHNYQQSCLLRDWIPKWLAEVTDRNMFDNERLSASHAKINC